MGWGGGGGGGGDPLRPICLCSTSPLRNCSVLNFHPFPCTFPLDTGLVYKVIMATVTPPMSGNLGVLAPVVVDEIQVSMCVQL